MQLRESVEHIGIGVAMGFVMGIVLYQASSIDVGIDSPGIVNAQNNACIVSKNPGDPCPGGAEMDMGTYCYVMGPCTCMNGVAGACAAGACMCTPPPNTYTINCFASGGGGTCVGGTGGPYSDVSQCIAAIPTACPVPPPNCTPPETQCGGFMNCCLPTECDTATGQCCPNWCQNSVSGGGTCCAASDACDPNTGACIPTSSSNSSCPNWCQNSVSGGGTCCAASDACDPNTGDCIPTPSSSGNSSSGGGCCNTVTNTCE